MSILDNFLISTERSEILSEKEFKDIAAKKISKAKHSIIVISAYIKKNGLDWLFQQIPKNIDCKIYAKFSEIDIISGSSDLDCFIQCQKFGWQLYINTNLHSKVIVIDNEYLLVGSQNLTTRGYGLAVNPNFETGVLLKCNHNELSRLESIFNSSILFTTKLYEEIRTWLENTNIPKNKFKYPDNIVSQLKIDFNTLHVLDFPQLTHEDFIQENPNYQNEAKHLMDLMKIDDMNDYIKHKDLIIKNLKVYLWLHEKLKKNNQFFFGALSDLIHNTLIDDPKPYRTEIKKIQKNLYTFISSIEEKTICIDQPNYSERIYLIK